MKIIFSLLLFEIFAANICYIDAVEENREIKYQVYFNSSNLMTFPTIHEAFEYRNYLIKIEECVGLDESENYNHEICAEDKIGILSHLGQKSSDIVKKISSSRGNELYIHKTILSSTHESIRKIDKFLKRKKNILKKFPQVRILVDEIKKHSLPPIERYFHYIDYTSPAYKTRELDRMEKECAFLKIEDGEIVEVSKLKGKIGKYDFHYCYYKDKMLPEDKKLLYFFHGLTGSSENWESREGLRQFRETWRRKNKSLPPTISVSVGKIGLLSEEGKLENFVEKFAPYLEKKYGLENRNRMALGVSMGGANVLQFPHRAPTFFKKIMSICASIGKISPFSSKKELDEYIARTNSIKPAVYLGWLLMQKKFKSEEYYNSVDPFNNMEKLGKSTPSIYMSVGENDEIGLKEGVKNYYKEAKKRNVRISYHETLGDHVLPFGRIGSHCVIKPKELYKFLSK